jgi:hypothetical protein
MVIFHQFDRQRSHRQSKILLQAPVKFYSTNGILPLVIQTLPNLYSLIQASKSLEIHHSDPAITKRMSCPKQYDRYPSSYLESISWKPW